MTKPIDPIERLVNRLLTQTPLSINSLKELIPALADSPNALAELTALSSALTGESSNLLVAVERLQVYQASLDLLAAYVEAELAGLAPAPLYPTVAEHIRTYPRFRQQYEELLTTLREDAQGEYGTAPSDLNFAAWHGFTEASAFQPAGGLIEQSQTPPSSAYWWDELGHFFLKFSAAFLATIQPPAPQPAYGTVKSSATAKTLYEFSLEQPEQDLVAQIWVKAEDDQPELCSIELEINIPSRGSWPHLGDIEVIVKGQNQLWGQKVTNPFGQVTFSHIPVAALPELLFEITPDP